MVSAASATAAAAAPCDAGTRDIGGFVNRRPSVQIRRVAPRVFLTDFGLAKDVATASRYTRSGESLGTPPYMSPEQARGELATLDATCDTWALGCVLYELLAGHRAFDGENPAAVIGAVLTADPPCASAS